MKPPGLCIELCPYRYEALRNMCRYCPQRDACIGKCEFTAAINALGSRDVDVWFIDMDQREINRRVMSMAGEDELAAWNGILEYVKKMEMAGFKYWEEGLRERAMHYFSGNLELMRETFPTLWRVLILERNVLMACRISYIVAQYLGKDIEEFKVPAIIGAAHVEGVAKLLKKPEEAFNLLKHYELKFSMPYRIRRIAVT